MKENNPQVSVIIPTYNRAHLIGRAIKSVLNQTYQNFEIIVVDDGSTDATEEVVKGFNDSRIRYIRHNHNRGGAAARNTGIKATKSEYIAFQDSDDKWLPEKLKKQMKVFKRVSQRIGVVYTGFWKIENDEKWYMPFSEIEPKDGMIHDSLLRENFIDTSAAVVKRECFNTAGMFDEKFPRFQDWELWIRISKYYEFKYIKEPLVNAYYGHGNISYNNEASVVALEFIFKRYFEDIKKNRTLLIRYCSDIGHVYCLQGQTEHGRRYILQALKAYPFSIKLLVMAFLSLFDPVLYKTAVKMKESITPQKRENAYPSRVRRGRRE